MYAPTPAPARPALLARLTAVATVMVAMVLLRMTRDATLPIVAGLLIAAVVWPIRIWCERFVPGPLALLATILLVIVVAAGLAVGIGWSAVQVGERIVERRARLEQLHERASEAAARVGIALPEPPAAPGAGAAAAPAGGTNRDDSRSTAQRIGAAAFSMLGTLGLTIGFAALALAEARGARRRIRARFSTPQAERGFAMIAEVAHAMHRYVMVKSLTSFITGVSTLLLALAFGLDLAAIWGLLAFLLEFVPTIGSILAVIPPSLYALVQFEGIGRALAFTGALTVMQLFLGNYVDPRIEGRLLSVSPFVVLASIVLWSWIWGAPGALLGVPLTIAMTTVARHFEGTRWIWALLTDPNGDAELARED